MLLNKLNDTDLDKFFFKLIKPLSLKKGDTVLITFVLWKVAMIIKKSENEILHSFHENLKKFIGKEGTIVCPAHSLNLCGTKKIFDLNKTPSYERGHYVEYIRLLNYSKRSLHPFASYVAIGKRAKYITAKCSKFAYGPNSPEARLIELNAKRVGIGVEPLNLTTIHHVEQTVGVPYRYMKEFIHPIKIRGKIYMRPFYLYVRYENIGLKSNKSKKLFSKIGNNLKIKKSKINRLEAHSFSLKKYFELSVDEFTKDPFIWSDGLPSRKPYRS